MTKLSVQEKLQVKNLELSKWPVLVNKTPKRLFNSLLNHDDLAPIWNIIEIYLILLKNCELPS